MPAAPESLQYVQIKDFTPGISDAPGANYPPGAAQRNATFRCIANRNGALEPLPRRQTPFAMPHAAASTSTQIAVNGLHVPNIGMLPTVLPFTPGQYPEHEVFVGIEWLEGGNRKHNLYRNRRYESTGTMDVLRSITFADSAASLTPVGMGFATTRSNRANWRSPGVPVVVAMYSYGANHNYVIEFPNDQSTSSNTPYVIFSDTASIYLGLCAHQGRIVMQLASAYGQGVDTVTFMGEAVIYSDFNDLTTANWWSQKVDPDSGVTSLPIVFIPENPAGLSFLVSMSANQVFGVKNQGGMYVTGDLAAGAVAVSLPMVTGSELLQTPVVTSMGVVYGNRTSGVWVWGHGDLSQLISPAMTPDFWVITSGGDLDQFGGIAYQFARCDDWVLVPNNFLYDTITQSWWRLEDESVARIRYFSVFSHFIYGSESFYTGTSDTPIHEWVREDKALSFSWQSQPLWETVDNLVDIREIVLRVRGAGTVKVTATGETSSSFVTFTGISATLPVLIRQPFRLQDANVAIKIESTGATGSDPAPTIYECNVGFFQAQKEAIRY
jgi:hypothetical protein